MYFYIKNLKTRRKSKKLNYIKVRLFLILEVIGLVNYRLQLLVDARIYLVFYILLLKPVDPKIPV